MLGIGIFFGSTDLSQNVMDVRKGAQNVGRTKNEIKTGYDSTKAGNRINKACSQRTCKLR